MANKKKRPTPPPPPIRKKPLQGSVASTVTTSRAQKRRAAEVRQGRDTLRQRLGTAGLVVVVLASVGLYVFLDRRGDAELRAALTSGSCETDSASDPTAGAGANHVPSPTFQVNPPAGGNHLAAAARGGMFEGAAVPADGMLVHSLEHGYIVLWHRPDLPQAQKNQLRAFEERNDGDVIVAERAGAPTPVAATAWNRRLLCEVVEPAALDRFFDEYVGEGPEQVERG